jgi:hypothetical protein
MKRSRSAGTASPAASVAGAPHLLQNRAPAGSSAPQAAQLMPRRAPQPRQKFDRGGLSCWHREQIIGDLRASALRYSGQRGQASRQPRLLQRLRLFDHLYAWWSFSLTHSWINAASSMPREAAVPECLVLISGQRSAYDMCR